MHTERKAAYSSHTINWRGKRWGDIEVRLVDVDSADEFNKHLPPVAKFPGGDEKDEDQLNPKRTAIREFGEETGLSWRWDSTPVEVFREVLPRGHFKQFYALMEDEVCGTVKTEPTFGEKGGITSPPYWCKLSELDRQKLAKSHREALAAFEDRLRNFYKIPE